MTPSAAPSQSNLFFSPTAAGSNNVPGGRGSTFLPSGFYAAGNSSPGGGGQQGPSISLTNLRPDSMGYPNGSRGSLMGPSPPDSPHFSPRRDMSSSSVNLNNARQPGQRAPSAYLEDLLADEPGSLPPPQMPPSTGPRGGDSPRRRY
ncbi:hypothetical protein BBK36DRAFT_1134784 [Trichoderma citrinoviride]|uniref:Uncharacterized protein n=1 Tax=Trichoderma citrinoviride TaxID=58853 RepID=A0A2T4BF76_9HYPO|nr:hypothetical protein BBK36DRAFT_1134784 [Trichoderma citrinoviride]PTB67966.1 hypothetical protein BBK36DRAFT_1134784 [Trichoderma citrinoviride]